MNEENRKYILFGVMGMIVTLVVIIALTVSSQYKRVAIDGCISSTGKVQTCKCAYSFLGCESGKMGMIFLTQLAQDQVDAMEAQALTQRYLNQTLDRAINSK